MLGKKYMQISQGRNRDVWWTQLHFGAGHRIQYPRCDSYNDARRGLDMCEGIALSSFNVMLTKAATVKRMPAISNDSFLPDMGRMSGRWLAAANPGSLPVQTAVPTDAPSF